MQLDWQRLMATHTHAVVLSLLARGVRLSRARELTHETWSRLFEQHEAGLLPRLELPGLAIRQASFLALRDGRVRPAVSLDEPEALELPADAASAEEQVASRQQLALAQATLSTLSPRAQQVFTTAMTAPDQSQSSLASELGLSLQRFRQTLCEVRARLKLALEEERR